MVPGDSLRSRIDAVANGIYSRAEEEVANMPAKLKLSIQVEREELVEAIKHIPIRDVSLVLSELSDYYAQSAPEGSPRAQFATLLLQGVRILHGGEF